MQRLINYFILMAFLLPAGNCFSQGSNDTLPLTGKYFNQVSAKLNGFEKLLDKKTGSYLRKISRQEKKLYKRIRNKDSTTAAALLANSPGYIISTVQSSSVPKALNNFSKVYSGKLDSLGTAFSFLKQNNLVKPDVQDGINKGIHSVQSLQGKLDQAGLIKKQLEERKAFLAKQLAQFGQVKEWRKINRQISYYQQQVQEYKQLINDPARLEEKLLGTLAQLPAFRNFFNRYSALAGQFRLNGIAEDGSNASLTGLQTRASVTQNIQDRFGHTTSVQRLLQQQVQQGKDQLSGLNNQLPASGQPGNTQATGTPDFKPNNQKTKSFKRRLEVGVNFQSERGTALLPATSDIGLSIGYRLNDKSLAGIGAAYKLGWGQSIRNIHLSHQGIGLRSFLDWKLKGSFYVTGGYEVNYRSEFNHLEELKDLNAWKQSGLLGISKIVAFHSKLFRKTKLQLLYDFLYTQQVPLTQPVLFRVCYNF